MLLTRTSVACRAPFAGGPRGPATRLPVPLCRVAHKDDVTEAILTATDDASIKELTKQLIESDPETQEQLKRYQEAMVRVERAKAAADELEKEYREAAKSVVLTEKQEEEARKQKAQQLMADAEVAAAEKLLLAAELEAARAKEEQARLSAQISQDAGRVESGKAAAFAVVGGAAGLLPISIMTADQGPQGLALALSLTAAAASCALFGVTYRYAVGSNPLNPHLKGGVVAAFGLVRAAAAADMLQRTSADGPFTLDVIGTAALYAGQSVLMFGFAAAVIEAAFQQGFIKKIDEVPGK